MPRGLNKVILIGNLGRDPEVKYTQSGLAVVNLSIATSETWTKDGNTETKTVWHNIVAFSKLGETCGKYLTKGKQVYIEGKLQTDEWEKDGVKRYSTKIIANQMLMLGGNESGGQPAKPVQQVHPEPAEVDDDAPF